jgi:hypothetical protein
MLRWDQRNYFISPDTLDCLTCVRGEIYLVTDTDEVLHAARRHGDHPRRQSRME